ncbi:CoA-binding protein [Undibacterium cyanobacteriorum]|uniref:CoA-binding protein n=1 Tax=Undibacterium cyanobacteriorum TaxID=3073561 RepID=A0ABY9RII3_9BURK|nr:CoA-binding protein [Undibacterium sp. 20NA77.5]WMW80653.1 CoA-binding protein [Undibacterium sp. 20NA77.5]
MHTLNESEIDALLNTAKVIAIVGLSNKPERDSFKVAQYLQEQGYTVLGVNPVLAGQSIEGVACFVDLAAAKQVYPQIDIVDCFRKSEEIPAIVTEVQNLGLPMIWMQLGVIHEEAAEAAAKAGIAVVMDRCTKIEHKRMVAAVQAE